MSRSDNTRAYEAIAAGTGVRGWYGFYLGTVEATNNRLGRVRVRVAPVHGGPERTPTDALPWALVAEEGPGVYDAGSFDLPEVGAQVMVMFKHGHRDFPGVLGAVRGRPARAQVYLEGGTWLSPAGVEETPRDVFAEVDDGTYSHTRRVWRKSVRGHTIVAEDKPGAEFLQIIDRAGQVLEFRAAVTEAANENNAAQRGTRHAAKGRQLPRDQLVDGRGLIRLLDVAGQELLLDGSAGGEYVELRSQNRTGYNQARLRLTTAGNRSEVELTTSSGDGLLANGRQGAGVTIQDRRGTKIELLPTTREVKITGDKLTVAVGEVTETLSKVSREIGGDLDEKVFSNRAISTLGDDVVTSAGGMNRVVGGAFALSVANAGLSGVSSEAIKLAAVTGAVKVETNLGALQLSNLLGSVAVDEQGGVTLRSPLGTVSIDPTGQISITSVGQVIAASQITLDGVSWAHAHITPFGLTSLPQSIP